MKKGKKQKKKANRMIICISVLALIIVFGIILILNNKKYDTDYSGVYETDYSTIKLYKLDDERVIFSVESRVEREKLKFDTVVTEDGRVTIKESGVAKIDNNDLKYKNDINDYLFTFKLDDDILYFNDMNNIFVNGAYHKNDDYSKEECYEDNYGEIKNLDTKYNGVFKRDDGMTLVMYQTDDVGVNIFMINEELDEHEYIDNDQYYINGTGGILHYDDEGIKITVDNDKLIFNYKKDKGYDDVIVFPEELVGEYKKVSDVDYNYIMDNLDFPY